MPRGDDELEVVPESLPERVTVVYRKDRETRGEGGLYDEKWLISFPKKQ